MTTIKLRRDTAADWASANPVLADGEPAVESDTGKLKLGDGATAYADLPYFINEDAIAALDSGAVELAYAENVTGTPLVLATTADDIPACSVVVTQQSRPVWVEGVVMFDVTTQPGTGATGTVSVSILNLAGDIVGYATSSFEGANGTSGYVTVPVKGRVAPNTPGDTYRLQASKGGIAAFGAQALNGAISPAFKSWIKAELQ